MNDADLSFLTFVIVLLVFVIVLDVAISHWRGR